MYTLGCRGSWAVALLLAFPVARGYPDQELPRRPPHLRPLPREVQAACDLAYEAAAKTPGVTIQRDTAVFSDQPVQPRAPGCRLVIDGSFAQTRGATPAVDRLAEQFSADGWEEMTEYSADGKDGTAFAFQKSEVLCHIRGEWNGGSDGEPEFPAEDWYKVTVLCSAAPHTGPDDGTFSSDAL